MAKQIQVRCPPEGARLMIDALRWFTDQNYPVGADECSIAARDALSTLAAQFERELLSEGESQYSIRMRAFLSEAVRAYLAALQASTGESFEHRSTALIAVCRGKAEGEAYTQAAAQDAAQSQLDA